MIFAWIKRQWPQLSTKIGLTLAPMGAVLAQYQGLDPRLGYAACALGVLAIAWNQRGSQC